MTEAQHLVPLIPGEETNPALFFGATAGLALALALGFFPVEYVAMAAAILLAVTICVARPTWAIAVVLLMLPLELLNLQLGDVGLTPMQIGGLLVMVLMGASALTRGRLVIPETPLDVPMLIWISVGFLGCVEALDPPAAIKKAGMAVVFAALYWAAAGYSGTPRRMTNLLRTVVFASSIVAAYAVWVAYRFITTGEVVLGAVFVRSEAMTMPRAAGAIGNPNGLASLMVIVVPIALALLVLAKSWPMRLGLLVPIALLVTCLGFTFSRGGWIGAIASLVVLARDRRFRVILLVAVLLFAALAPGVILQRVASSTQFERVEIYSRFEYWQAGLMMFAKRPILGIGNNNFPPNFLRLPLPRSASGGPVHAHNLVINLLAENGIVGLLAYFMLMLSAFVCLLRGRMQSPSELASLGRLAIAASLSGFLAQQFTEVLLLQPTLNMVVWIVLGLGVAMSNPTFGTNTAQQTARREIATEPS